MDLLSLLITILVMAIIFGVVWWILTLIPLPAPMMQIAQVVIALIFLIVLISMFFGGISMPFNFRR